MLRIPALATVGVVSLLAHFHSAGAMYKQPEYTPGYFADYNQAYSEQPSDNGSSDIHGPVPFPDTPQSIWQPLGANDGLDSALPPFGSASEQQSDTSQLSLSNAYTSIPMPYDPAPAHEPYPYEDPYLPLYAACASAVPQPWMSQQPLAITDPWGFTPYVGEIPVDPLQWTNQMHLANSEPSAYTPYSPVSASELYSPENEYLPVYTPTQYPPVTTGAQYHLVDPNMPVHTANYGASNQLINTGSTMERNAKSTYDPASADTPPDLPPKLNDAMKNLSLQKQKGNGGQKVDGVRRTPDLTKALPGKELRHAVEAELRQIPKSKRPKSYIVPKNMGYLS
ncbi:hypothetical protein H4R34_005294, partial [Dimargaris verticillata]